MGTLTQQPFVHRPPNDSLARPVFGGAFNLKHRSPSPARRQLFPDSLPRRPSSAMANPIQETIYSKTSITYSSPDGLPPRKFSGLVSSLEESSRRSSRATSPFDEYSNSRRSSRATSPFSDDFKRRRSSRKMSRSSRGSSPFDDDMQVPSRSKSSMQSFIDSLRSRTPSPSGRSSESPSNRRSSSPPSSRRRSSSVFSDISRRMSNSPYHTLPRSWSRDNSRAMSVTSDSGNVSLSNYSNGSPHKNIVELSTPSPSANANGARVDKAIELLRRLSEDWSLNTEKEEDENRLDQLTDQVKYYNYFNRNARHPFRRSSSTDSHNYRYIGANNNNNNNSNNSNTGFNNSTNRTDNNFKLNHTDNALAVARHLIEEANRRSPSPPKFYSKPKSPFDYPQTNDNSPNKPNLSNGYHPSNGYGNGRDQQLNGYNSNFDNDVNGSYTSNGNNLNKPSFNIGGFTTYGSRYSNGPSNSNFIDSQPSNNNNIGGSFNPTGVTSKPPAYNFYKPASSGPQSAPARLDEKEKYFLPFTFPEQFPYKIPPGMTTNGGVSPSATQPQSSRRFSEEGNFRRPLATLHEDEVMARRRFSEDVRKKYHDTSEVADDLYNHQRRLSEAGIRKYSDASVVLTEDTDQFIIGQRVWVGGSKPGSISFIGETQFAPGDWAGVTLDEPIGKNDGSVAGVRYFQCEARKGVFSRLTRLSRSCLYEEFSDRDLHDPKCARSSLSPARSVGSSGGRSSITPTRKVSPPSSVKSSSTKSTPMAPPTGASVARKVSNPTPVAPSLASYGNLSVGERVVINNKGMTRVGVLRHLGRTEFADGLWAGAELDEPLGKNDGSVAGKKYFTCKPKYGLFAPIQCIQKVGGSSTSRRTSIATTPSRPSTAGSSLRRSNSRESLGGQSVTSSVGASSVASSVRPTYRKSSYGPTNTAARAASNSKALQVDDDDADLDGFY